jgi:hypothetical protein
MIINTTYKFIFVHVPKVAGTSVMKCLKGIPGDNRPWLAKTRHETLAQLEAHIDERRSILDKLMFRSPDNYFTFGFVRNPWDRMSSFYRYLVEKKRPIPEMETINSFRDFLLQAEDGVTWIKNFYSMRPQLDYFTFSDGVMRLGFLGHFEHLSEDISTVSECIGHPIQLPHRNRSSNMGRDYRKEYDDEMVRIVESLFMDDINHFGYTFDARHPTKRCSGQLERRR